MPEVELIGAEKGRKKKHFYFKIFIGFAFILILLFIIATSFPGVFPVTGSILTGFVTQGNSDGVLKEGIDMETSLTIPDMTLDGNYETLELVGSSSSFLKVGNQQFDLGDLSENYLTFKDFDGKISFDGRKIYVFEGKVSEVNLNGVSVTPTSETSKVEITGNFNYKSFEIGNGVFINKLSYQTSGTVSLNNDKNIFNLNNENITITDFRGSLLADDKFNLNGDIQSLSISGKSNINIKA